MSKAKPKKDEAYWEAERQRLSEKLRETNTTPFPTQLESQEDWLKIRWPNVHKFNPAGLTTTDLPAAARFREAGVDNATQLHGYLSFKIKEAQSKKRKLALKAEQELKKQCGERPLDESLFGGNVEAREAAMNKALWNEDKKEVTMKKDDFVELGGCQGFWKKRYDEQEAAKVLAAKAAESLRRSTRVRRPTKHYNPATAAKQTGASPEDGSYPHLGVEEDEPVCRIILGEGGEEALKALGLDWVCGAWQSETALDMKLRGLMEQLSRILTIGAVTTKVHCDQALAALERELDKRLAAWYASLGAAPVAPLGASNHGDASSAPAACVGAAAADGADVRDGAPSRNAAQTACGGAASALGGNAEPPSMAVLLDAARADNLDLRQLLLDRYDKDSYGAARFADGAPADPTVARPADLLTRRARGVSPDLENKHAIRDAFNELRLDQLPTGRLGLVLLDVGLAAFDATGKAVPGAAIERMQRRVDKLASNEKGAGSQFYPHKVVLVAVQYAFANKLLDFKRMQLSLFQCVFGR